MPSGSFRVRVYAGIDPLTGKRHYLREVVPAGPKAAREAEKVRTRLLAEVDDRRNPRTNATVSQLLERYLGVLEIEDTTRSGYESMIRLYIRPLLGDLAIGRIDGETLDAFYAELRRCRTRCDRRSRIDHRTDAEHECMEAILAPVPRRNVRHRHATDPVSRTVNGTPHANKEPPPSASRKTRLRILRGHLRRDTSIVASQLDLSMEPMVGRATHYERSARMRQRHYQH